MGKVWIEHDTNYRENMFGECNELGSWIDEKWDFRFLDLAKLVSSWSKDPSTQTRRSYN